MLKWIRSNLKDVIVFIAVFVFAIPLIINLAYKQHWNISWLETEWSVDTTLTFYGSIIAACVAVYGVFLTIQYSQNNYKEDLRNRTLPFIVIDILKTKSKYNLFVLDSNKEYSDIAGYTEYKVLDYYCILENGNISYQTKLTQQQEELRNHAGWQVTLDSTNFDIGFIDYICIPIEIENVGNGTAVSLRCGLNRFNTPNNKREYLPRISLKPSKTIMFHIFSTDCGQDGANLGKYQLEFYYEDIYANKYSQIFDIEICFDEEKNSTKADIDMHNIQKFGGGC